LIAILVEKTKKLDVRNVSLVEESLAKRDQSILHAVQLLGLAVKGVVAEAGAKNQLKERSK